MLEKTKKINSFLMSIGLLFVFLVSFSANMALSAEEEAGTTLKERAVFAFFRAAGTAPDYDFWIKSGGQYDAMPEKHRDAYVLDEMLRLGRGYSSYDADEDLLELTMNVIVKYVPGEEGEKPRIIFEFFQVEEAYIPTFSYPYGEDVVSLIIDRLAAFSNVELNETQNEALLPKIPYEEEYFDAKLVAHVRIKSADTKKPVIADGAKQWLMIGDAAYLKCEVASMGRNRMLWDYVAPWYEETLKRKNMPEEEKYPHPYDLFKD